MSNRNKLLSAAIITSLLAGCGGGESGGGGSSSSAVTSTSYSYTFLEAENVDKASADSCTVFSRFTDSGTEKIKTYHSIGNVLDGSDPTARLVAFYSSADGSRSGDLISSSNGVISFTYEDIPDDGFITIEERNGNSLLVTSFTKAFLSRDNSLRTARFGVDASIAGTRCVTGSNYTETTLTSLAYENTVAGGSGNYTFSSQLESYSDTNPVQGSGDSLEAFAEESTMIKEMESGNVHIQEYAFQDWALSGSYIPMVSADLTDSMTASSNIAYSSVDINLIYDGFAYDLVEYATSSTTDFNHPGSTNGEAWVFSVTGATPTTGWDADYYGQVDSSWTFNINDADLYPLTGLSDTKPTVSGSSISLSAGGVDFTDKTGLQRVSYKRSYTDVSSNVYSITHNIYDELNVSVVVPTPEFFNFSGSVEANLTVDSSATLRQNYLIMSTASSANILSADFMNLFAHGDNSSLSAEVNGIVRNEIEATASDVRLQSNEHLRLYRDN